MLSAVVITKNEEQNVAACLESLKFADEIVVVDSGSADRTVELARRAGARVETRAFDNFAAQKNFAVRLASGDWIISVDADERVSAELAAEIRKKIMDKDTFNAYHIRRRTNLFGRDFRFSGLQHDAPIRLFRKSGASFENAVHEIVRHDGRAGTLGSTLEHRSFQTLRDYWRRLEQYTAIEAAQSPKRELTASGLLLKPFGRFCQIYFMGQGFRDGIEGFIYAVLSGYYEFVRWIKQARLQ